MISEIRKNKIKNAIRLIENSKHLTAFTGAGVSTDSGIPDVNGIIKISVGILLNFLVVIM